MHFFVQCYPIRFNFMNDFLTTYRPHIIYGIIVVVISLLLRFTTQRLHRWLVQKAAKRFPNQRPRALDLLRLIFNVLWIVLGVIALSFIFVGEERYSRIEQDFKLVLYLGTVAVLTIVAATSINLWFRRAIDRKMIHGSDPTNLKFLRYVAVIMIYLIGVLFATLAFPSLQGIAKTALGGAGVIAIIAGVASQEALANLVGGVFIISFKPFKIGDVIEITSTMVGTVVDITLRHTVIRNFENKMIVIPNSIINKERLINYDLNDRRCCERIEIGISYDSDVMLAKTILRQECEIHPLAIDNRSKLDIHNGKPRVRTALTRFNDSSVTIRAWVWTANFSDAFDLRCDVLESVKLRFEEEGIELPYPYRTVVVRREGPALDTPIDDPALS